MNNPHSHKHCPFFHNSKDRKRLSFVFIAIGLEIFIRQNSVDIWRQTNHVLMENLAIRRIIGLNNFIGYNLFHEESLITIRQSFVPSIRIIYQIVNMVSSVLSLTPKKILRSS